jgi:hypothetical protein
MSATNETHCTCAWTTNGTHCQCRGPGIWDGIGCSRRCRWPDRPARRSNTAQAERSPIAALQASQTANVVCVKLVAQNLEESQVAGLVCARRSRHEGKLSDSASKVLLRQTDCQLQFLATPDWKSRSRSGARTPDHWFSRLARTAQLVITSLPKLKGTLDF